MSRSLTISKVMEDVQGVLHDLHDIHARAGRTYEGSALAVEFQYRDFGSSKWLVRIEPMNSPQVQEYLGLVETGVSAPEQSSDDEGVASNPE